MIERQRLAGLMDAIASDAPSPGAGAAAGVALALGVACGRKALAISLKHGEDEVLSAAEARLANLGTSALASAERDAETFRAALAHEPGADAALVQQGKAFLGLIDETRAALEEIAGRIDTIVCGDVLAARALIGAAEAIARSNLAENAA